MPIAANRFRKLSESHLAKLAESGLRPDTIERSLAYTEHRTDELRRLLRDIPAVSPALILPGFDRHGNRNGWDVARMNPPHRFPDGREAKYLQPAGVGCRVYFPPFPLVWEAVNHPGRPVVITEGILKSLAVAQAGVSCLGLMGTWNWVVGESDPRKLIPDLAELDWQDRPVLLVFDTDPTRKPNVNHAAAELARVLAEHGADVRIGKLPLGPPGPQGKPKKTGLDDFIVRLAQQTESSSAGDAAFCLWVQEQWSESSECELVEWRAVMFLRRMMSLLGVSRMGDNAHTREVLLDASPTGSGKSFADLQALRCREDTERDMNSNDRRWYERAVWVMSHPRPRSLILVPSHLHCAEVEADARKAGLDATAFPRHDRDSCCQFDEASAIIGRGLSFRLVLCPECPASDGCPYREQFDRAMKSSHAIATHARGVVSLPLIAANRNVLTLHETALDALRPTFLANNGLLGVEIVARQAESVALNANDRGYFRRLASVARYLHGELNGSNETTELILPESTQNKRADLHAQLNEAYLVSGVGALGDNMRVAMMAVLGQLHSLTVIVDEVPDGKGKTKIVRNLAAVARHNLPADTVVWLNDATASRDELQEALGRAVRDVTPQGRLLHQHDAIQVIPHVDITKSRKASEVLPQLRGLLYEIPEEYRRIGLLTHWEFANTLPKLLEEPFRERLGMVSYFGSGLSRGSNAWIGEGGCDFLLVLGTPRVGPDAVRLHLVRLGNQRAAKLSKDEAGWAMDWWSAVSLDGRRVTVRCWHYRDHAWHAAYCSLVRSELVQAIGRARGILPGGIPVVVVSNENLAHPEQDDGRNGPRVADQLFAPLTEAQARVLGKLDLACGTTAPRIAKALGLHASTVKGTLNELRQDGRARLVGEKRGSKWLKAPPWWSD
jgi:hypothetical protein